MRKIYLLLFSLLLFSLIYCRDPDIPLKMDVTLPSVVYFSKSDSMSTMLLYPYIYNDTMNKLFIEVEPYRFNQLSSYISIYKNNFLYRASYDFLHDSLTLPLLNNNISLNIFDVANRTFSFSVFSDNKSIGNKKYSTLDFDIFKLIKLNRLDISLNIYQIIENRRTSGTEKMLFTSLSSQYKLKNFHRIFIKLKSYNNNIIPIIGYCNKRNLYHDIHLGIQILNKKIVPYTNIKYYFHKGFLSLFYNPTYQFKNIYNFTDSIPNAFLSKGIFLYEIKHYSGIGIAIKGIKLYSTFGNYEYRPYFDTLTNSMMISASMPIIYSGINAKYENRNLRFRFNIVNNYAIDDTLSIPDFFTLFSLYIKGKYIRYNIVTTANFDYLKKQKFTLQTLLLKNTLDIKFSRNFIVRIYGEYNPYYKIYGELYSLPVCKYGILVNLIQKGL